MSAPLTRFIVTAGGVLEVPLTPEEIADREGDGPLPRPLLSSISRRQLRLWLAVTRGIPLSNVDAAIAALPEPDRTVAAIEWADATSFQRAHPMIDHIGAALGLSPEDIDQGYADAPGLWP